MAGTIPPGKRTFCSCVEQEGGGSNLDLVRVKLLKPNQNTVTLPKHLGNWFNIFLTNSRGVSEHEDRKDCTTIWENDRGEITHNESTQSWPFEGQEESLTPDYAQSLLSGDQGFRSRVRSTNGRYGTLDSA